MGASTCDESGLGRDVVMSVCAVKATQRPSAESATLCAGPLCQSRTGAAIVVVTNSELVKVDGPVLTGCWRSGSALGSGVGTRRTVAGVAIVMPGSTVGLGSAARGACQKRGCPKPNQ